MILPTKHLRKDRAILSVGGEILSQLDEPYTVSELWERVRRARNGSFAVTLTFDWFILALSFLYAVSAIDFADGVITASTR
ncbi:ABC-three component system middle component 6 [Archangium violaceum]|uniref:ABC-three component system middle component 6 n=1 Tax=Archangium violaceum TaxID=83451 RepID=UPI00094965BF|nr:ABC-three component system middle component 6 [Archangium violaceum]